MKLLKLALIINMFFLLITFPVHSQELKAIIYVSNQPDVFDQNKIAREYVIEETAFCTFFAQGFSKDLEGQVHLTAHVRFIDPSGNILFEDSNFAQNRSAIVSDQKTIPLKNRMDITFEETDPLGMYKLNVQISDHIAKTKAGSETTLLLFDTKESKDLIMAPVQDAKQLD